MTSLHKPLEGVRVLDIATMLAGPFCGTILSEFGADVLKIELPGRGCSMRSMGGLNARSDAGYAWLSESRNKRGVTLDLRKPEGAALFKRMVAEADIVIENFLPGTLERWGLGPDVLKEIKSDLILVRVSAYGQTGPYKGRPGFARVAHGYGGLTYLAGEAGSRPVMPGSTSLADYITGMYAAIGALMSYIARDRFGVGNIVDIALYEGILRMLDDMIPVYAADGFVRERMGPDTVNHVPHSHYATKDGQWTALACTNDAMWQRLCDAMGRPDLATDARYATMPDRLAHREEVNGIVADYFGSMDRDPLLEHLRAFEVPVGPINNVADIFADEHIQERGNLVVVDVEDVGPVTMMGVLPRLSETPGVLRSAGPKLGEHTDEVLAEMGIPEDEIARLREANVI
ncbi:CaiB/BaiF CoA transferase family protein [Sphingobium subterraneum]|uniref:Crotonobetainyl-CoA:carnitine CoA-transferase CaiB-like acyl-CoA transferase n=1 Tax=Sphingobium subterraneum TaxID=627688 RepID=A0A841J4D6_9SPHN|nr:CaiB/BaiF CoA-transferase family protein [Sphingobium subterraneum]MBB6123388.1 crotonobetainyl-CoA:carnitine CoA-transferase CaiB-like acyl-CoA transferase [Sphingobium subterraneum]